MGVRASQAAHRFLEAEPGQAAMQDTCPTTWRPEGKAGPWAAAGGAAPQTEGLCRRRTVSGC